MAGNVWEWTRSLWGKKYPYRFDDGREDETAGKNVLRVLRGGSFGNDQDRVRCAARGNDSPNLRLSHIGFRVVVSPSSS